MDGVVTGAQEIVWKRWDALKVERADVLAAFEQAFPSGSEIQWTRGGHDQVGKVIDWRSDHVWAKNVHTGRVVKLSIGDLIRE